MSSSGKVSGFGEFCSVFRVEWGKRAHGEDTGGSHLSNISLSQCSLRMGTIQQRGHLEQVAREAESSKRVPQILMLLQSHS